LVGFLFLNQLLFLVSFEFLRSVADQDLFRKLTILHRFLLSMSNSQLDILVQLKNLILLIFLFINPTLLTIINNGFLIASIHFEPKILGSNILVNYTIKQSGLFALIINHRLSMLTFIKLFLVAMFRPLNLDFFVIATLLPRLILLFDIRWGSLKLFKLFLEQKLIILLTITFVRIVALLFLDLMILVIGI